MSYWSYTRIQKSTAMKKFDMAFVCFITTFCRWHCLKNSEHEQILCHNWSFYQNLTAINNLHVTLLYIGLQFIDTCTSTLWVAQMTWSYGYFKNSFTMYVVSINSLYKEMRSHAVFIYFRYLVNHTNNEHFVSGFLGVVLLYYLVCVQPQVSSISRSCCQRYVTSWKASPATRWTLWHGRSTTCSTPMTSYVSWTGWSKTRQPRKWLYLTCPRSKLTRASSDRYP